MPNRATPCHTLPHPCQTVPHPATLRHTRAKSCHTVPHRAIPCPTLTNPLKPPQICPNPLKPSQTQMSVTSTSLSLFFFSLPISLQRVSRLSLCSPRRHPPSPEIDRGSEETLCVFFCFIFFFFFYESQGFPQDLGFWPPRGTSQKKVEFFFFFQ